MDHTILPKYQTIEIKNTSKTSKKSFDSIMMFGIVFFGPKNLKGVVNCQNSQDKGPPEGNSARG